MVKFLIDLINTFISKFEINDDLFFIDSVICDTDNINMCYVNVSCKKIDRWIPSAFPSAFPSALCQGHCLFPRKYTYRNRLSYLLLPEHLDLLTMHIGKLIQIQGRKIVKNSSHSGL